MAPWQLPEFLAERVQHGRRLLEGSEEYRGGADLQAFMEQMDQTVALHRLFLDDQGQARQGLSDSKKEQDLVLFLLSIKRALQSPCVSCTMDPACTAAVVDAAMQLGPQRSCALPANITWLCLFLAETLWMEPACALFQKEYKTLMSDGTMRSGLLLFGTHTEARQRARGLQPTMSMPDMWRLVLLARQQASYRLAAAEGTEAGGTAVEPGVGSTPAAAAAAAAAAQQALLAACRELTRLEPTNAAYWWKLTRSLGMQPAESAAAARRTLQLAEEANAHLLASRAALALALNLQAGGEGPHWSLAEVHDLLARAERHRQLCKAWLPDAGHVRAIKGWLADCRQEVDITASKWPGQDQLPAELRLTPSVPIQTQRQRCDGCGRPAARLRRCKACASVSYCSRECQVRHWKHGGHKACCAEQAAGAAGGDGDSSSHIGENA